MRIVLIKCNSLKSDTSCLFRYIILITYSFHIFQDPCFSNGSIFFCLWCGSRVFRIRIQVPAAGFRSTFASGISLKFLKYLDVMWDIFESSCGWDIQKLEKGQQNEVSIPASFSYFYNFYEIQTKFRWQSIIVKLLQL